MQACSGWCPPATTALHHPPKCSSQIYTNLSAGQKVPEFPTGCDPSICPSIDGRLPPTPPLNSQSQMTGNLAVYGFVRIFSPFLSPVPQTNLLRKPPPVPGCNSPPWLFAGAHARFFLVGFQGRQNCNFTTSPGVNSCVDGGCTGGLQCDPHTGTVRHFPTMFTYTQLTHPSPVSSYPLPPGPPWAPCRVCRPRRWRNGRSAALGIKTFTMVRVIVPLIRTE